VLRQRPIAVAGVAVVIAIAIGITLSYAIHWFPAQASTQAHETDTLYHVLVIASIPIFVLVVAVILYSVWQFRMKPGEELKDGPPIHGNTRLEVFWTAIPTVLLLGLVGYSFVVLKNNEQRPAGHEIQIDVTAQQFEWSYQYPPSVTGGAALSSYQLYVPEGESVYFNLRSKDVIHAFWIPAFRIQEDVVPGITTHWRATPDRLGSYPVVCNLLCGLGHGLMRSTVHVVSKSQFQAWISSQLSASSSSAAGAPASG
jgi:cytochrome c oxidase subunit 2